MEVRGEGECLRSQAAECLEGALASRPDFVVSQMGRAGQHTQVRRETLRTSVGEIVQIERVKLDRKFKSETKNTSTCMFESFRTLSNPDETR